VSTQIFEPLSASAYFLQKAGGVACLPAKDTGRGLAWSGVYELVLA
jgi:hypothetical protein